MRTPSLNKMTEENQRPFIYLFDFTIHVAVSSFHFWCNVPETPIRRFGEVRSLFAE
jgi:hypothetical protein